MNDAYVELAPPVAARVAVACLWRQRVEADRQLVVPDGCVDLIWFDAGPDGGRLVVAGPDTTARQEHLHPGETAYGVRLRPGAGGPALGLDVSGLRDRSVQATEVWGTRADETADALSGVTGTDDVHRALLDALSPTVDPLVTDAARHLAAPSARVGAVARDLGVSERQLHRRVVAAVGYGPKTLARVLRLQRLRGLDDDLDLADRALSAGYASQAHMGDEVRLLTGTTPVRFLEDRAAVAAIASSA